MSVRSLVEAALLLTVPCDPLVDRLESVRVNGCLLLVLRCSGDSRLSIEAMIFCIASNDYAGMRCSARDVEFAKIEFVTRACKRCCHGNDTPYYTPTVHLQTSAA